MEKAGLPVQLVITDREEVLDLRLKLEAPVAWLAPAETRPESAGVARPAAGGRGPVLCHPRFAADADAVRGVLDRLDATFDLAEPFQRIREAIGEARKMGVAAR